MTLDMKEKNEPPRLQVCCDSEVLADKVAPSPSDLSLLFLSGQDHPLPEAAEDQGAAAESDRGLWSADGHVLHGEGGRAPVKAAGWMDDRWINI